METSQALGLAHLWTQSDTVIRSVALLLAAMSVVSWTLIALRALRQLRARRHDDAIDAFWAAPDISGGLQTLAAQAADSPFDALARSGAAAAEHVRRHDQARRAARVARAPVFGRERDAAAQRCFGFVGAVSARLCFGEQV